MERMMQSEDVFWEFIDRSKRLSNPENDFFQQTVELKKILLDCDAPILLGFISFFERQFWLAYTWDLWALATIAYGGCSDGNFEEFRAWLISRGKESFENALNNLDYASYLVKQIWPYEAIGELSEQFYLLPNSIYESKFGVDPYSLLAEHQYQYQDREPSGRDWEYAELASRFPKICKMFNRTAKECSEWNQ